MKNIFIYTTENSFQISHAAFHLHQLEVCRLMHSHFESQSDSKDEDWTISRNR